MKTEAMSKLDCPAISPTHRPCALGTGHVGPHLAYGKRRQLLEKWDGDLRAFVAQVKEEE